MRGDAQLYEDACTIRGILDLLESQESITIHEVSLTQHVSRDCAHRLMNILADAHVVERRQRETNILGAKQKVPCLGWHLTDAARRGEISMDAEQLAEGMA